MKLLNKKITVLFLGVILILNFLVLKTANSQPSSQFSEEATESSGTTGSVDAEQEPAGTSAKKSGSLTCAGMSDPSAQKGYIITVLEERIAAPGIDVKNEKGVLNCVRETKCVKKEAAATGSDIICTPEYVEKCTPSENPDGTSKSCQNVQILYSTSGANIIYTYIGIIYRWAAGTIGMVTVFYIVLGGIEIATAGSDSGKMDKAKERIIQSISGLVLLFLSALILYTINPNFFTI